jgi:hypothetical protein
MLMEITNRRWVLGIEHAVTKDEPDGRPAPPPSGDRWHIALALPDSRTMWHRIKLGGAP